MKSGQVHYSLQVWSPLSIVLTEYLAQSLLLILNLLSVKNRFF